MKNDLYLLSILLCLTGCSKFESSSESPDKRGEIIVINCQSKPNLKGYSTTFAIHDNKVDIVDHPPRSEETYSDLSAEVADNKITISYRNDFKYSYSTGYHLVKMTVDRYTGDYDQQYSTSWYKGAVENVTARENRVFSGNCATQQGKKF